MFGTSKLAEYFIEKKKTENRLRNDAYDLIRSNTIFVSKLTGESPFSTIEKLFELDKRMFPHIANLK